MWKWGKIIFENTTYHVNSVMKTTGLQDCEVDLHGTLLWSENITYWLDHSMPVGYQNQSTVWFIGGDNVKFDGHGYGTLDGNGQVCYDFVGSTSNYPRLPMALTVTDSKNSEFTGIRFIQSQMWTLAVTSSEHVSFTNVFVNNTGTQGTVQNTDGANTIYSSHITFRDWEVINGDDSISVKANSTDILIENCTFRDGLGISIGSIGQYNGVYETVQRVIARNITLDNTDHAAYFKTWTGEQVGYPPNGGGGGLGVASDFLFEGFTGTLRGAPFSISQCTTFSGASGNCTSSKFQIRDVTFKDIKRTSSTEEVASFQCSAVKPCENISVEGVDLIYSGNNTLANEYLCGNVDGIHGFECTGAVCVGSSATAGC
ncbi:pectin lyase-like protein [Penicillium malachiteum]|uniref:Pectin lyase-like protein n=1 Tax=Penicillium malachiteum TaxID=1324776 RepID=A0AAD6HX61_9EURO|nr:pectin lyase-like protein [Penicillium malachiteum]